MPGFTSPNFSLSQSNPGAQDLTASAVSLPNATSTSTARVAATATMIGPSETGLLLPNTATSGAVPQAPTSAAILAPTAAIVGTEGEVIATSGGSSITGGATGKDMPGCMAAWEKATHITKTKWREICARTLNDF